jgi:CHASE2 domain-containing sensor protein
MGALLAVLCGLVLGTTPLGDPWANASYDYTFRFGARTVTNRIAVILIDNEAYDNFRQTRGQPWDRVLHADLLNRLANDGCPLVVFDSFFRAPRDAAGDEALVRAMRRLNRLVLMAEQAEVIYPGLAARSPDLARRALPGRRWSLGRRLARS